MIEIGIAQLIQGKATGLSTVKAEQVAALQVLIGDNPTLYYPDTLPENTAWPCASYQVISEIPAYGLGGQDNIVPLRLQIDAWSGGPTGASALTAKGVALAIRKLLAGWPRVGSNAAIPCFTGLLPDRSLVSGIFVVNAHSNFEQDARVYRSSADYLIHFTPAA